MPASPSLIGRWTYLRPVVDGDYGFLFAMYTSNEISFRLRFRGETPSPDAFTQSLWHRVLVQFIVCRKSDGSPLGHAFAYNADLRSRTSFVGVALVPDLIGKGWALEGAALLVDYVFRVFDLRKVYGESFEFNVVQFESGLGRKFKEEGRLKDHEYFDGEYWDLSIMSVTREEWMNGH